MDLIEVIEEWLEGNSISDKVFVTKIGQGVEITTTDTTVILYHTQLKDEDDLYSYEYAVDTDIYETDTGRKQGTLKNILEEFFG